MAYLGSGITFPIARADAIIASGIAFPVVGAVLLTLRGLGHAFNKTSPGLADLFSLLAWMTLVGMGAIFVWGAQRGSLGWPRPQSPETTVAYQNNFEIIILQSEYFFEVVQAVTLGLTKLSILFFFRRIFVWHQRTLWDRITRLLVAVTALWTIGFTLAYILPCGRRPSAYWSASMEFKKQYCLPFYHGDDDLNKSFAISDLILDVFCLGLPFPIIWTLQLSLRHKISITAVFLVGFMTVAAGASRLAIWYQVEATAEDAREDTALATSLALYWRTIETGLAYIAAQLPALSSYLRKDAQTVVRSRIRDAADLGRLSFKSFGSRDESKAAGVEP